MTIQITPVSLHQQRIKEDRECLLEIHVSYLRYRMSFVADEPNNPEDESLGWKEVVNNFDLRVKKEKISSVEKWKCTNISRWKIIVSVEGMAGDINIYFRTEAACDEVFNKLFNYIFNGD